jgi:hypothetical protein
MQSIGLKIGRPLTRRDPPPLPTDTPQLTMTDPLPWETPSLTPPTTCTTAKNKNESPPSTSLGIPTLANRLPSSRWWTKIVSRINLLLQVPKQPERSDPRAKEGFDAVVFVDPTGTWLRE